MIPISVIIPVYNAEKYIGKCIGSILSQKYDNFELILINDGSIDHSAEICKDFATKDKRITVLSQKNSGASSARNRGIELASGRWITFIDADDYIDNNYLDSLFKHAIDEEKSLIIQGLKQIIDGNEIKRISFEQLTLYGNEIHKAFNEKEIFEYGYSVAKLYNRDIVIKNRIRFNESISYSEDMLFMLEYILYCDNIKFVEGANYNYIMDASNLSQRYNSFESEHLLFTEYTRLNNAIAKKWGFSPSYKSLRCGALMLMRSVYAIYINNQLHKEKRIEKIGRIKKKYSNYIKRYYTPKITLFKLLKLLFLVNIRLFDFICTKKFHCK